MQRNAHSLLVYQDHGASGLSDSLARRGWVCEVAPSFEMACQLFGIAKYDLVLSEVRMHQATANPLIRFLTESEGSMFLSQGVEAGCWWLPVLRRGQMCWGAPALRPGELARALEEIRAQVVKGAISAAAPSVSPVRLTPARSAA